MSDEQRPDGNGAEPQVKVHDRRRFTPEGEAVPGADEPLESGGEPTAEVAPSDVPVSPPTDPRDVTIGEQAARIDELTRALAALIEDGKAARVRLEREKNRVLEAERARVAQALLEAVDSLERVLGAVGEAVGPLVDGVRLTLNSLVQKVSELGAVRIVVLGEPFDPRLAEAVDLVPVSEPNKNDVVVEEVRAGYRIGDRVLRPARVRVGRLAQA
ncbi:MAG TPA: nucleotide exchange factor GrpE [Anaeromyxobacteraceae bacterium]|nr:nucleotide exchange factor GrpE [Anaeromyxobacteraceae bacterium]